MPTSTPTARSGRKTGPVHGLKSLALTDGAGTYEAIVSVFGNVDYAGDRILAGAFQASLDRWKSSGDPIPVVFAHQWDSLDAHVGEVLEAEERGPGHPDLPEELKANGGLWVKFRLDVEEDFAGRLAKRLDRRTIREFSFAYDVLEDRRASDGATDLVELDVIEVGPCLKGMNPATVLMAKALAGDLGPEAQETAGRLSKELPDAPDPAAADGAKTVSVTFAGSAEQLQGALLEQLYGWASAEDLGRGGFYAVHLEATYGDHVIATVEGWDDPLFEGTSYRVPYSEASDGVELGDPEEIVVEAAVRAKARKTATRSATAPAAAATVAGEPKTDKGMGKASTGAEDLVSEDRAEDLTAGDEALRLQIQLAELDEFTP